MGYEIRDIPEVEPLPEPEPPAAAERASTETQRVQSRSEPVLTRPDSLIEFDLGPTAPIGMLPPLDSDQLGRIDPIDFGKVDPPAGKFDPVAATPRGNPGGWITNADDRPS